MLYIFSNSDDKSIHHIVCTDSDIRAGVIISRIYEREHISGEPIRVIFHNDTSAQGCLYGTPKRYEAIKSTDKRNDTFEKEVRANVAELCNPIDRLVAVDLAKGKDKTVVDTQYNEFINNIIDSYRKDKRIIALKDFIYHYINLKGYDPETLYRDVDAEICRLLTTGFKEDVKIKVAALSKTLKPNVAAVVPYDNPEEFIYKANINELVARYYEHKLNANRLDVIREVARNNSYDVDKFIKDVSDAHKAAYTAYIAKTNKSNSANYEK